MDEFAVILLDVQMPGMDGFETAAHIKRREKTRDVPIIFLTAINHGPHHAFRGYAAGAVDYISKPFDPWVLRAKVSVFVDLYMKNRQMREQAALLRRQLADFGTGSAAPGAGGAVAGTGAGAGLSGPTVADRPRRTCSTSWSAGSARSRSRSRCSAARPSSASTTPWPDESAQLEDKVRPAPRAALDAITRRADWTASRRVGGAATRVGRRRVWVGRGL